MNSNRTINLDSYLLFQKELQNILSLLIKEKNINIIAEEILLRAVALCKGSFGSVILHEDKNNHTFIFQDPTGVFSNEKEFEKEIKGNFTFLSKWFLLHKRSLTALNSQDNIGYNIAHLLQCKSVIISPCLFDEKLLATLILTNSENAFDPVEVSIIEQFASILAFSISNCKVRELNDALENRLLQAQKLETIGKLSSGMAHDFSNLLSSIFGSLNLLKKRVPQSENIIRLLDNIENCSIRAKDLTTGLLSFGKPTAKRKERVKPNILLSEISKVINQTFPSKISFASQINRDLFDVLGNSTEIYQVILNLCVNAKEAIKENGCITLKASNIEINGKNSSEYPLLNPGKYVHLTVMDTGAGISEENIQKIFDPYFSTKQKETGSGLGLYVSYGIVKAHNGHIEVTSSLNEGTSFDVYIPAYTREHKERTLTPDKIILLIDDELMLRDLLAELLESNGYNVVTVGSGIEAITLLTEELKVDMVIMDYNMPGMNGIDCVKKIRELQFNMPVILSTGSMNLEDDFEVSKIGINKVLPKPYEFETMLAAIKEQLVVTQ